MNIKKATLLFISITVSLSLTACSASEQSSNQGKVIQKVITVKEAKQTTSLYFQGTISPLKATPIVSSVNGAVAKMYFTYGQRIVKDQELVVLKSSAIDKSYQQAISAFLTAKEKYNTSKNNIVGAKDLHDSGITSRQTYEAAVSALNNAYLSYLQAEHALLDLLRKANIDRKSIYGLKIGDVEAVKKALEASIRDVTVRALTSGIALIPTKAASSTDGGSSGGSKAISLGAQVKTGQILVAIGDLSGVTVDVNVGETSINTVKVGDKAEITSPAFPDITLKGRVTEVGNQASSSEGGGLPTFPVTVSVKKITPGQQQVIHVGMSAKVKITIATPEEINIPIKAINVVNGKTFVTLINPKTGKKEKQAVKTGDTTVSGVNIISGLKAGDKIVISD